MSSYVNTKVKNVLVLKITIIEKEWTPIQIGQEASPEPTSQAQGKIKIIENEKYRNEDSILTMKP